MDNDYYKAYEERYKKVHSEGELWETCKPTNEVLETIKKYNITKESKIMELGCGEGRDAIFLLNKGYNVLATDYSKSAILKCNELTNYEYKESFKQFDLITDTMNEKFDFIYSIAVIHMFVNELHRKKFYEFIYEHLKENGKALIIAMGDGTNEYKTDPKEAFKDSKKININTNKEISVASTSCMIKSMENMLSEIRESNLKVLENKIVDDLPNFKECEMFIVTKK